MSETENQSTDQKLQTPQDRAAHIMQLMNAAKKDEAPPKDEDTEDNSSFTHLPSEVYRRLPFMLQCCTNLFADTQEREVFLLGALGVVSGMLPNVQGRYFFRDVSPNLYCFIIGKYGTGKGSLTWAKDLGKAVEKYRTELSKTARDTYATDMLAYNKQVRLYDTGKLPEPPQGQPQPPRHTRLFLPANSTKTAIMQLLAENDGRGIIFETEGDTLADMLRQDYGNFSDVLRKAYHHEAVSYFRRKENEDVAIEHPELSVILSGTHDQLRRLIPTIENGLYSRFCFYHLDGSAPFKNPWLEEQHDLQLDINEVAETWLKIYTNLERLSTPVQFTLQAHQSAQFIEKFIELKDDVSAQSTDLEGMANRLGLICFRITMILSVARTPALTAGQHLTCHPDDFTNALEITDFLLQHSLKVYEGLCARETNAFTPPPNITSKEKQEQICEVCRQHSLGIPYAKIALSIWGRITKKSTVGDWIRDYCTKAS